MGGQLGNVAFVIWRESVEALLVVGILNAWLLRQGGAATRGRIYLWAGVGAGLVIAIALGAVLLGFGEALSDDDQQTYQTVAVLLAAALIVQMVFWMRRHGRTLKRDLETSLQEAADRANWWGVFVLAAIAVAREGSETVVFLYGTIAAARSGDVAAPLAVALLGFALALATYSLLQVGGWIMSWRVFFRVTEIMLLFLAASLIVTGVDNLIGLGYLPPLSTRMWDSSAILPDSGAVGGLIGALTGYRARPDLMLIIVYGLYWGAIAWALLRPRADARPA